MITTYNDLKNRAIAIKSKIDFLQRIVSQQEDSIKASDLKISELLKESSTQQQVLQVFKELVVKLSATQLKAIEELVTVALSTIFYDKNYTFKIELSDKRNVKCVELFLIEEKEKSTVKSNIQDSVGGGILAIIGVILQLYFITLSGKSHILFVDEGFTQISSSYVNNFLDFIEELCVSKNFIFVLITHDDRFIRDYYTHYKVEDGKVICINSGLQELKSNYTEGVQNELDT